MENLRLSTGTLDMEFARETGALVRMESKVTGWLIQRRPELGLSWRLLVPVHDELRDNRVEGTAQAAPEAEQGEDYVRFVWRNVVSEKAGRVDIDVAVEVRREGNQAVWHTRIDNRSPYTVENVYCPYIGDLNRPKGAEWFRGFYMNYATGAHVNMWPVFNHHVGDGGGDYPSFFAPGFNNGAPSMPYILLRDADQGLYVGVKDDSGELVTWYGEMLPGFSSSMEELVPEGDEIAGKAVHTRFAAVHLPFVLPGESRDMTPVALEAYRGGWQEGSDIYKAWRDEWDREAVAPDWAREPHSWLQIHINSPEDELRLRFTELPKVARECADCGIKAIQLVGWNHGGQDQGNPSHDPDPRLGTFEELKEAIAQCHEMGVKIILFSKFTWADRATDWYRTELKKYAIKDPYGDEYLYGGYPYQTATQLLDINTKRLIPMCFASPEYMAVCRKEFAKLTELGAAGMLFDECLHHTPARLCFDTSHGHRPGWPVYQNDRQFVRMLRAMDNCPPDFLMAGEACYDWEMEEYQLSYFRSRNTMHIPLARYLRPRSQIMTAVNGFNDRNMVNQCLMYRYIISYEPYGFKGWPHDTPVTIAYGMKMDALRREYRKWFWDGEYRDTCGASVTGADGTAHHPFARFRAEDGTSGLVICNYGDEEIKVRAALDEGKLTKYRTVEDETWRDVSGGLSIPPRSAVIVL